MSQLTKAWELTGDEGEFRLVGGRATYTNVMHRVRRNGDDQLYLARLEAVDGGGLHVVARDVDWDADIVVERNYSVEHAERITAAEAAS